MKNKKTDVETLRWSVWSVCPDVETLRWSVWQIRWSV
jgi:hypothetical protein